ncbi:iron-sulfur cluster assembly accessory protein [Halalkalibacillus sediminis]|uniref:Iron-sulfur cluster assembly accessory protein n=1 Tax=Halalkalibacillus sediminis TaxID=2018042 RepID=A0A2I0QUY1_9BACI|nr:iron-sulfur cluster assembly accessory protein [Halalkalibacillus sediminis]PKR78109.1 iron-sulfur cluster assembly accessory protein [Halalkalibacillus sediminis]
MAIEITDQAVLQINEMMKDETAEEVYLRFGVKGGGCSGLSYKLGFDYEVKETDNSYEINGIPVVIATMDVPIIENTKIDFKQNMMGGGFTIDNPNAIVSCGCGSSFKAKDREGSPENC